MTAKEYLSQAYRIDQRINTKLMRISELRALAQKCTVAYGGEQVSRTRNVASLEDAVMKIMEAEKELDAQIDLLVDTKKEIESVIERVPDADCRLLLEMRYLAMESWTEIARQMNTYPLCEMCRREGRITPAAEVHHILPLADGGTHDPENLMALCKPCHSRITATEGGRWGKPRGEENLKIEKPSS